MTFRVLATSLALLMGTGSHAAEPNEDTQRLHRLFDAQWEAQAQLAPESSTYRGDYRYNDRLSDVSPEAVAARDALSRQWLAQAQALRRDGLGATDRTSLDLFIGQRQREVALQAFAGYRTLSLTVLGGPHSHLAQLMNVVPMNNADQARQLLARLAAYPAYVDQHIANMRRGMALGYVASRDVLDRVLAQIDGQVTPAVEAGPFWGPFGRLAPAIAEDERLRLQAAGHAAITGQVIPALQKLRRFVVDEYRPRAPANGALSHYPDGAKLYDELVRQQTTTDLSAAQVHAIGQRELKRLRAEMEAVRRETRFDGDFAAFVEHLNTDPKFFYKNEEDLLNGYRAIAKRIDAELPRLFAELPRLPYGVRSMPAHLGPDHAAFYVGPALDGTRAGFFNANTLGWARRPTWSMATLVAHEAVPGHHLQIARNTELGGLPPFRRGGGNAGYTAFVEGWALYAETLGLEIGLYDDPYSRFGHLQKQAFRAARLVVDTGIHALGWSRQQAIDFMVAQTGVDRPYVTSEVDRYTSTPGQALAYMVGKLKIDELRDRARTRLGARFDLRSFHNAVIDNGALPLDVLDRRIEEWMAGRA
jgi:uncharacterized protein (DUF885 family)